MANNKKALKKKIDGVGFVAFFLMLAVLLLLPEGTVPEDTWLIGFAAIVFVAGIVSRVKGVPVDRFFLTIAFFALAFGVDEYFGIELPFFPILFIGIAVAIILHLLSGKKKGKGDDWPC